MHVLSKVSAFLRKPSSKDRADVPLGLGIIAFPPMPEFCSFRMSGLLAAQNPSLSRGFQTLKGICQKEVTYVKEVQF